jgi:predicted amidohydrolase YtcJ
MNSRALAELARANPRASLPADGRLYDGDLLLRSLPPATPPPVAEASRLLARLGVTGLTDMTPHNDNATLTTYRGLRASGALLQHLRLAGRPALGGCPGDGVTVGETKIHLHEAQLPDFAELVDTVRASHGRRRPVAVHCVTETELVFTLAAIRDAGALPGDRLEHASVTPPALLRQIQALGLVVVTQPNFVAERGDAYRAEVPPAEHDWLYRGRAFLDAGIPLAGGTDMPFGGPDPWAAMEAAVTRRARDASVLGAAEALTPEEALALFIGAPEAPARPRTLSVGAAADLCLLDRSWRIARNDLRNERVAATFVSGALVWSR